MTIRQRNHLLLSLPKVIIPRLFERPGGIAVLALSKEDQKKIRESSVFVHFAGAAGLGIGFIAKISF